MRIFIIIILIFYSTSFNNNLEAGFYDLEISDSNNCVDFLTIEITESSSPLTVQVQNQSVSCFGSATGSASVVASGGTSPYFYEWSSGHVTSQIGQLSSGLYSVHVTDSRGCTVIDNLEISENNEIISQLSSTPTTCFGSIDGTATIFSTGGTGNLTYTWSNGESTSSITSGFGNYWVIVV